MTQETINKLHQLLNYKSKWEIFKNKFDFNQNIAIVKIDSDGNYTGQFWYKRGYLYNICRLDNMTTTIIESDGSDEKGYEHICDLERSLPYLRPMSSLTEEENKKLDEIWLKHTIEEGADYLNSIHVDYRGLIPKGLALEAPKGMYKEEQQ